MIKYLFILVNSVALYIFGLFSGDNGVKVTGNFPATLSVGKEIDVEIRITKGDLSGFGRLQMDVPDGITVKNSEEKEYEFRFEENKAKWIYASLPAEQEIVIKTTLVATESAVGERVISAMFSYVENNEKRETSMEPFTIKVISGNASSTVQVPPKNADSLAGTNAEPPGHIVVERVAKRSESEKEFIITVKIKKGATKGFARYSDDTHENLSAKSLKTDGSSFSIADGKIKFVWVNVPEKDEMEVAYTLSGNPSQPITLNGEYSYLEDNQSKKIKLEPQTLDFGTAAKGGEKENPKEAASNPPPETSQGTIKNNKGVPQENIPQKKDGNAVFGVQIGAFTNQAVSATTLKRKFKVSENIRSESQSGFAKFMVGSHKEYKKAREHSETMKSLNGIKSAFVVAYNDGKRITVQEALMVTNQRWFK